jgi:hypothetical protein
MTRIDHTSHTHPATPAARAICRKATIRIGDAVMVHLDDAPDDFAGTVEAIDGNRFYVRLASRLGVFVHTTRTRKA